MFIQCESLFKNLSYETHSKKTNKDFLLKRFSSKTHNKISFGFLFSGHNNVAHKLTLVRFNCSDNDDLNKLLLKPSNDNTSFPSDFIDVDKELLRYDYEDAENYIDEDSEKTETYPIALKSLQIYF